MRDLLQEFPDRVVRRRPWLQQCRAERCFVALRGAANEIIAEHVRHPPAVDPPILGVGQRRAHRNARRGIGTLLLEHCEKEARARGFSHIELMATLPGVKLYAARGYVGSDTVNYDLGNGETIKFVPMRKALLAP